MTPQRGEVVAVAAGLAYLLALTWSMTNTSYDIWGALVLIPIYGVIGILGMRYLFRSEPSAVANAMCWGLLIKLGGACARYWVGFEAYGGSIDAGRYHEFARAEAGAVWSGQQSAFDAVPSGSGTEFVDQFTAFVYTLTGASKLAGFVTYSFLAFWGLAFIVKAATIAIPGLAVRKYAWLCVVFPSIVYWPSSIGKEALMMLGLGVGTYGIAVMLTKHRWVTPLIVIGVGLGFAAIIRPHMAGIWVAASLPALILGAMVGGRRSGTGRRRSRLGLIPIVVIASIGLSVLASTTVQFLQPPPYADTVDDSGSITAIFEETTRRTAQAGSQFTPPSVSSPLSWPYAVARTLTRPLPIEARGIAQLVSAVEMFALFVLYAISWRRVKNVWHAVAKNPYVLFVLTVLFLTGLAFSVFANLGVLARQKSLVIPFLLLPPCLPLVVRTRTAPEAVHGADPNAAKPALVVPAELAEVRRTRQTIVAGTTNAETPTRQAMMDEIWR